MKLLFENWRKYINEARPQPQLQRVLHDIGGYGGDVTHRHYDDEKMRRDRQRSTVGYGLSDDDVAKIKTKMEDTPQDWMIIAAKNIGAVEDFNTQDRKTFLEWFDGWIKKWLEKRKEPENFLDDTIFLVIQSPHLKGDEQGSQWFIHDLGHSINYIYEKDPFSRSKRAFNPAFINYVQEEIGGAGKADFDRLPDVFAAIILGKLKQEKMEEYGKNFLEKYPDNKESVKSTITEIFGYTNWWLSSLGRGPKNLNFVQLWNPTDPNDK